METVNGGGTGPILFGQRPDDFIRPDTCLPALALVVLVSLGLWIVWSWRKTFVKAPPATLDEQIEHYRNLVAQGQLDPEEFDQIKAQLEKQAAGDDPNAPPDDDRPPDTSIRRM